MNAIARRLIALLLCSLSWQTVFAEDQVAGPVTDSTQLSLCQSEQRLVDGLEQYHAQLQRIYDQIIALQQGQLVADVSPIDLLSDADGLQLAENLNQYPEIIQCDALKAAWIEKRQHTQWLSQQITELRSESWSELPPVLRDEIVQLWRTRSQLEIEYSELKDVIGAQPSDSELHLLDKTKALHDLLLGSRIVLVRLLTRRVDETHDDRAIALFGLWRFVVNPGDHGLIQRDEFLNQLDADVREAYKEYLVAVRIEILQLRTVMNEARAYVWTLPEHGYRDIAIREAGGKLELMKLELRSVISRLDRIWSEVSSDYQLQRSDESFFGRLTRNAFKTGIGLALLLLLVRLAQLGGRLALSWHANWSERVRSRRNGYQVIRLTAGLPTALPWILGWLGLDVLGSVFYQYEMVLLVPLIPFGRLFILYGTITVIAQWLISRVVQQAGSFLTPEQLAAVDRRARISAAVVMLPWLCVDLLSIAIGPSLVGEAISALREAVVFISVGMLLNLRQKDLVIALQSVLPPWIDPWVERFLHPWFFVLTAPLTIVILVPFFAMNVGHRLLLELDWYRTLYARGFRMQAAQNTEDEPERFNEKLWLDRYQQQFEIDSAEETPIINTGLEDAVIARLTPWLNDHGEENSLVLTGERGMGKTCGLIKVQRRLAKDYSDVGVRVVSINNKLTDAASLLRLLGDGLGVDISGGPAALARVDAELAPVVLIIEDAHNLFLRKVGGFDAWEALMALINTRVNNLFWLVVLNNQGQAYLDNVFSTQYPMRNVLKAKAWSQSDIRSLIISRHRRSNFQLRYDDVLLATRGPEAGNVRNAEQRYFSLLWEASRGNPSVALCLWFSSLKAEGNTVIASLPALPKSTALEKASGDFLFVFSAILLHENMRSAELSSTTALAENVVRAALKSGTDGGFLMRDDQRRYRIAPTWYPAMRGLLARKNMLHE